MCYQFCKYNSFIKNSITVQTYQLFDVVEEEAADGGADADVVRERPHDGQDGGLHLRI